MTMQNPFELLKEDEDLENSLIADEISDALDDYRDLETEVMSDHPNLERLRKHWKRIDEKFDQILKRIREG